MPRLTSPTLPERANAPTRAPAAADVAATVVSVALLAYVAARAATLAITIDEALTWAWHVTGTWPDIVLLRTAGEPDNNHVLLTLAAKLAVTVFGLSEFTLRLPTLVGFALFLAGVNTILRRIVPGWTQVLGVCAIGLNPYLVDYFSVVRGYGLGLGLATAGIAALLAALADTPRSVRPGATRVAFLLLTLAAVANLTFLLVLVAGVVALWAPFALRGRAAIAWRMLRPASAGAWCVVVTTGVLQAYLLHPLLTIRRKGLFDAGGSRGFWTDTAGSLIDGTLHAGTWPDAARVALYAWVVATLLLAPLALRSLRTRDPDAFAAFATVYGLLLLVAVGSVLQHLLFGVAWLTGRRAIVLVVLLMVTALSLVRVPRTAPPLLRAGAFAAGVVVPAVLVVRGLLAVNTDFILDWKSDAAGREMMLAAKAWIEAHPEAAPARLRVYWPLAASGEFYRNRLGLTDVLLPLSIAERPGYDGPADLYYVRRDQLPEIARYGVAPLRSWAIADTVLVEAMRGGPAADGTRETSAR